jgi:sugar phosphate isomerase/epimerase
MKLAFSTNAFTRFPLTEALAAIGAAGFPAVEILADVPHAYPATADPSMARSIAAELDRLGLTVSNINANCSFGYWKDAPPEPYFEPSLISPNPRHRADRASLILRTLDFARIVGAKKFVQSIRPLLDRADALGIDIGIECEPGLYIEYVAELRDWIDRLAHPRLGANLDIGHCQVIGEDIPDAIALLAGRIWNFHVEDIPGRKHYHMIPGTGTLNWHAFAQAVKTARYDRCLTVELYTHTADPQTAARESFAFLTGLFA